MTRTLEVLFTPADFAALRARDLSHTTCVVFDVLRFTSTIVTALANGAEAIIPVDEIADALALKECQSNVLLGGERNGLRIRADLTGGTDFDLDNSPCKYTSAKVAGKTIVATTTNGTRALRVCAGAKAILVCSFLNLGATGRHLEVHPPDHLLLVCSGTHDQAAYEDTLAAGALSDSVWSLFQNAKIADSAHIARQLYLQGQADLTGVTRHSRNARRLLALPELRDDVAFCLRRDVFNLVACLDTSGRVVKGR